MKFIYTLPLNPSEEHVIHTVDITTAYRLIEQKYTTPPLTIYQGN